MDKRIDLTQLGRELTAAGVPYDGLGLSGESPEQPGVQELFTYADGEQAELPQAAVPIVDAHTAPPNVIEYAGAVAVDMLTRTTDDVAHEAFRFSTQAKRVYRLTLRITGIDAANGTTRDTEARVVFKRPAGTVSQVGTTAVLSNFQDAAASTWAILPSVDGTDAVISVKGAAGRTIDWLLVGEIGSYAPEGAV